MTKLDLNDGAASRKPWSLVRLSSGSSFYVCYVIFSCCRYSLRSTASRASLSFPFALGIFGGVIAQGNLLAAWLVWSPGSLFTG